MALQLVHTAQDPMNAEGEVRLCWHYKQKKQTKSTHKIYSESLSSSTCDELRFAESINLVQQKIKGLLMRVFEDR